MAGSHLHTVWFHPEGISAPGGSAALPAGATGGALARFLRETGLRAGIASRLPPAAARRRLASLLGVRLAKTAAVLALPAGAAAPGPTFFRAAARRLGIPPERFLAVSGEAPFLEAARRAGWRTLGLDCDAAQASGPGGAALVERLRMELPLPAGKLPNEWLARFLHEFLFQDPSLLINPGVGEDIAAVDVTGEEVLILKSDPITFATDAIGQYAVLVNANDIATAGADPRWFLATLLFPPGTTPAGIRGVLSDLSAFCRRWGITLCGGHTEVTDAVVRPVVCGTMAGRVRRRELIDKRRMRPGDVLLMTKSAGVEGTAILAREFAPRLRRLGLPASEIARARGFLERISVLAEARSAAACGGVSAMHDVTEGGVATAIAELAAAGGCELRVDLEAIPVRPETRRLCRLLGLDPLGLIGSGSLLIACRPGRAPRVERAIRHAGIEVTRIGEAVGKGAAVRGFRRGRPVPWPRFAVDEIARLFA